jgi:CelD/BcsL family acetyltransferase involved in cellulose biosynthesis
VDKQFGQTWTWESAMTSGALAELCRRSDTPVESRPLWQTIWAAHNPEWQPWLIGVSRNGGELGGAIALGRRKRRGVTQLVPLGHGTCDQLAFPVAGPEEAELLAHQLAVCLNEVRGSWTMTLRNVRSSDPALPHILAYLPEAIVLPGLPSPTTRFHEGRDLHLYTSRNYRSQARHKWNRLRRELTEPRFQTIRGEEGVRSWLSRVQAIARKRDAEICGRSRLDDPQYASFFRDLVLSHARIGALELGLLTTGEDVMAYSVAFLDGSAYRQWNKHLDSDWGAYSPGLVLDAHLLGGVLGELRFMEFDWMAGNEVYKQRTANDTIETVNIHVGTGVGRLAGRASRLRQSAREWLAEHPRASTSINELKRALRQRPRPTRRDS